MHVCLPACFLHPLPSHQSPTHISPYPPDITLTPFSLSLHPSPPPSLQCPFSPACPSTPAASAPAARTTPRGPTRPSATARTDSWQSRTPSPPKHACQVGPRLRPASRLLALGPSLEEFMPASGLLADRVCHCVVSVRHAACCVNVREGVQRASAEQFKGILKVATFP